MRRVIFTIFLLYAALGGAWAQGVKWNKAYQDYIDRWGDVAVEQMQKYRIPASITLAQGVLESGAGRSELARRANNHFGIKCNNGWTGRTSYHDDDERGECFRAYGSVYESYVDHSLFLTNGPRYRSLFSLKVTDYKGWARGLKRCGYATSPTYASRLISIIETYQLYRYDTSKGLTRYQERQLERGDLRHIVYANKNYYVVARRGDTFRSISADVGVSYRRLARYNERDKNDTLEEGERVWLKKKRRKAAREYKGYVHRVAAGESMYSISQYYGIRLKRLYKLNDLSPDYRLQVGDMLRVR